MVQFTKQKDGRYRSQIDNLELHVSPIGYELIVWDYVTETDCDYDGCSNEDYDDEAECIAAHDGHCPREFKDRQQVRNDFRGGLSSFEEVEANLRSLFKKSAIYRSPAATRFANEEWRFAEPSHHVETTQLAPRRRPHTHRSK